MDILTAIGSKIGEYLVEGTIHQARYLFCFNSIVEDLKNGETNLKAAHDDIKERVEREERNTKEIEKVVEKWLNDAGDVMADVQRLKVEIEEKKSCLNGWCPNWGCRYWLGRKATKKTSIMLKLQNTGNFSTLAHLKPLPGIEFSSPRDFMSFKATGLAHDQLMKALKNENTKKVGLYGAGGVGKTTLATVVGQELQQQQVFDEVVIATVSQNPNILDVQAKLAESLSLKMEEVTKEERAKRLYLRFTQTKSKILVILDDVWNQHLDLKNEFGIPVDDNLNGCKILLTTRRKHVCGGMGCNPSIALGILEPEEGLALLKCHAGINDHDSTLIDVSKEVAGECKGLPLAIVAVGRALRGKDVDEWNQVAHKLKNAKLNEVDDDIVDVYACLKLSYDYVKDGNAKLCFLLCSLYPEDFKIDLEELVRYGVGLGWYQGVETIEKARSLFRGMIKGLKDSSLLLDAGKEGFVKMHDIVRDVAIWIGSKEMKFFNIAVTGLTDWPEDKGLKQCRAISLLGNKINVLPNNLVCPNLHILLLGNYELSLEDRFVVPDQFFEEMTALKVATIINGDLSIKSLQFSTNLEVLQLIRCDVRGMAFLGKLKRLQILCLKGSIFGEIPHDVADELSKLKLIDLPRYSKLRIFPIKRFSQLQEFYGIMTWEVERTNAECLSKYFTFPQLQRYNIEIGVVFPNLVETETNVLCIENIEATSLIILSALYQNLQYLFLKNIQGCQNILPSIDRRGFNELTNLKIKECEDLECIMDNSQHAGLQKTMALHKLRKLKLESLPNLTTLCSKYDNSIWPALQKLSLVDCPRLTINADVNEFVQSLAENLQDLKVRGCYYLCDAIVALLKHGLKNLEYLYISDLGAQVLFQLPDIIVGGPESELFPNLKELCLYDLPEMEVLCEGSTHIFSLQNLTSLYVSRCNRLRYLFSLSQAQSLLQLRILEVEKCEKLEHIIKAKIDNNERRKNIFEEDEYTIALPMLKELTLDSLQNLTTFCPECYFPTWQALDRLTLSSCPRLTGIADEFVEAKNLQYLRVEKCYHLYDAIAALLKHGLKNLEYLCIGDFGAQVGFQLSDIIVHGQESKLFPSLKMMGLYGLRKMEVLYKGPTHFFCRLQNLTSLVVRDCDRLRHLLTPTLARNLLQLVDLSILKCLELEQIIKEDEEEDHLQPVCFPKLERITVELCPKLKHLFHISVAPSLQNLFWIVIEEVNELEEVFWHKDGTDVMEDNKIVMTNLLELKLKDLPNLTNCWPEGYQLTFPSLNWKTVENCPKFRTNL